jgi:hypothetical protein
VLMISYTARQGETIKMFPFWEATALWRSDVAYAECVAREDVSDVTAWD